MKKLSGAAARAAGVAGALAVAEAKGYKPGSMRFNPSVRLDTSQVEDRRNDSNDLAKSVASGRQPRLAARKP